MSPWSGFAVAPALARDALVPGLSSTLHTLVAPAQVTLRHRRVDVADPGLALPLRRVAEMATVPSDETLPSPVPLSFAALSSPQSPDEFAELRAPVPSESTVATHPR